MEVIMKEIKRAVFLFVALFILTGVFYPMAVTVLAQAIFPQQASGSLIYSNDGKPAGSLLIGQPFSDPKYFWSRPSATAGSPYNPLASGGSNLGPTSKDLINQISERAKSLKALDVHGYIPADLVMASGSGLDPHISPEAALMQIPRIARERNMSEQKVHSLVQKSLEGRQLGFLGEPRVNVLKLNLDLNKL
jgi:potassium-transporting ATPase KdpC subunit